MGCPKKPDVERSHPVKEVNGFLNKRLIDEEIKSHADSLYDCYDRRFFHRPKDGGRVTVAFVIASDGTVYSAAAKEDTLGSEKVTACLLDVFMQMQFPAGMRSDISNDFVEMPDGKDGVMIRYPLLFSRE